ncbi:hypothetical protein E4T56_gene7055, partial [Termitomyces sp. T112]
MAEFNFFCITIAIQRETGGNLAETLANLADVLRKRAQMKLKIRAMSSESKASAYIVGSLPFMVFFMINWVNPQYLAGFFADQRLIITGLGGLGHVMEQTTAHPHLMGFDVFVVGSLLAGVAAIMVLVAIYAALTARDPMQKRVKALNERREQLKAGIVSTSPKKRAQIVRRSETTDAIRSFLDKLKVLQDSQLADAQQKLAQAGIRNKEWAVAVILGRMVAPIILGGLAAIVIY